MARPARLTVVADTGPLYALVDSSDAWHRRVVAWWAGNRARVVVPSSVIPEVTYLLQTRIGPAAEEAFVLAVADGEFDVEDAQDYARIAALMREYADFPLGYVDASVLSMAETLASRTILTTDRRHFGVVRPRHTKLLVLVP